MSEKKCRKAMKNDITMLPFFILFFYICIFEICNIITDNIKTQSCELR